MEYLLLSGIPLVTCIEILLEQGLLSKKMGRTVIEALEKGVVLSEALKCIHLPAMFVSLIQGAEEHGDYVTGFRQCKLYYSMRAKWQKEIWKMSTYPLLVAVFVIFAISFMIMYVLPQFLGLYQSMGISLPWLTLQLFSAYSVVGSLLVFFLIVVIGLILFHLAMRKSSLKRRVGWEQFIYSFPLIRSYIRHRITHYTSMQCGALLKAGIPILAVVEMIEKMSPWAILSHICERMRKRLLAGEALGRVIEQEGGKWFLPLFPRLVSISEQTGQLDKAFIRVAEGTENLLKSKVEKWIRTIEPLFIFTVGIVVALTVVAIFLPMFNLIRIL